MLRSLEVEVFSLSSTALRRAGFDEWSLDAGPWSIVERLLISLRNGTRRMAINEAMNLFISKTVISDRCSAPKYL